MSTIQLTPVQRFWRLLKPDSREIHNVYVYAVFAGLVSLSLPLGIQAIVNLIQGGQASTSWIVLVAIVVLGVAFTGALQIFQLRITENLQQKIFTRAAVEFAYRIPRIRLEAMYRHHAPELMNRFFDVMSVQKGLSKILIDFSAATLQVVFGLILLSFYHPFFIAFSLVLVLLVYAIFRFTARKGLETSLEESGHKYRVAYWLEELARVSTTFKLAGNSTLPLRRTDRELSLYIDAREKHFKVLIQQYSLLVVFKVIIATGLLAIGGILVMEQLMNIGQFIAAEIIILTVMNSVEKLILSLETIYDVLTALEKIGMVTDLPLEEETGIDVNDVCAKGEGMKVQMKDVNFAYPDNGHAILNGVHLEIDEGEKVLITGPNGSGKSTLLQLVAGLYDPVKGQVVYNGIPKSDMALANLRARISDCLSQELLFEASLLENVTMGRENIDMDRVKWALEKVGLLSYVQTLPDGFNTTIQPLGKTLPRSTSQKLLIARAIVTKPSLLILEDAMEHLDCEERRRIIDFLVAKENNWTLVAVSSDDHFRKVADRTIILADGKVDLTGNYNGPKPC